MWICRIVSRGEIRPSLSFVSRLSAIVPSLLSFPPHFNPFRSTNHRFLIIPPPCAIVAAGQSATKPTPALSVRDIRQYPNECSTEETATKGSSQVSYERKRRTRVETTLLISDFARVDDATDRLLQGYYNCRTKYDNDVIVCWSTR